MISSSFAQYLCGGGGRRLALVALAIIVFILFFFNFMSSRLEVDYENVFTWHSSDKVELGDLRVVIFGSQDVLGSAPHAVGARTSWSEHLCRELNCSSLTSFIPESDTSYALTSNRIYGDQISALQQTAQDANLTDIPSADYDFLSEQYPVADDTLDLEGQIQKFLSEGPPAWFPDSTASKQTLWVFAFGTWDIWNLASVPLQTGRDVIDNLTSLLFSQIELLLDESYRKSAPAFALSVNDTSPRLTEAPDHFRILIPELFDVSLTPGWLDRPVAPIPHSKAEQMRNAAALTERWNAQIWTKLSRWQLNGTWLGWDEEDPEIPGTGVPESPPSSMFGFLTGSGSAKAKKEGPRPLRVGLLSTATGLILDAMTEGEFQKSGIEDTDGWGTMSENSALRFDDVWSPCFASSQSEDNEELDTEETGTTACEQPDDYLFYDSFTIGSRAAESVGKSMAARVMKKFFKPRATNAGG